ncbi:hypothetical protein TH53_02325 [Pedobacter lusitanus]|uniref:Fibronectin type-III domain-containing protein n=1 Tax=Pedobacter lusitanus TaxID=1503925 RepID=A0A0D0F9Z4_9SPHI|nr:hypothetical protein TH53_02325 [Pedobacter lusitanus]
MLAGAVSVSAQTFFRVIGGVPHLPAIDPVTVASPLPGMLIYSTPDKQPMIYNGATWETLCSSNINTATVKDYLEVKTGIPYLPSLNEEPAGTISSGGVYFSKTAKTMMVNDGNSWYAVAELLAKGNFKPHNGFSTNSGLKISKLPVLPVNPAPLGLSAGAVYINTVSKAIRFYDGAKWRDISCLPVISTIQPTKITNISALSGANIMNNGGSAVTLQGICWGTSIYPDTTLNTKTRNFIFGADTGLFPGIISGLQANTVYHVRAYAVNSSGIVYGEDLTFTSAMASLPSIITLEIDNIFPVMANSGGIISSDGGAPVTARGVTWNTTGDPKDDEHAEITLDGSGVGTFPSRLVNLLKNTTYYVRAYAVNIIGKAYGNLLQFTTPAATAPVLSSPNIKIVDITDVSAVSEVTIINNGGEVVTERGMSWSTDRVNIVYGPSATVNTTDIGTFICNITDLKPGTLYYVRAYAKNSVGTSFSSESSFITTSLPTLTTLIPFNYDAVSHIDGSFESYNGRVATGGGDITSNGVAPITKRGICWSTVPGPTTALATKAEQNITGNAKGVFRNYMTSLTPGTTYYVRAYAINAMGTAYGEEQLFTTPQLPQLKTTSAALIKNTSAVSGGEITDDGRVPVNTRGVCWSTTNNPSIDDPHTSNGSGNGTFVSDIKGLMGNTTYYIRAYAINNVGISYGNMSSFVTGLPEKPAVVTSPVLATLGATAAGGGEVTETGGAEITSRGLVWSLTADFSPSLSMSTRTREAGGAGKFNSTITGLVPNKTYYVRAYAVNSVGVVFGEQQVFKTFTIPSLITTAASSITSTEAVSGGDIFSDGGDKVTKSGIVWSTAPNPATDLPTKTQSGTGVGTFIHTLPKLMGNTTYYVRAYATNNAGTAYGNEISFTTGPPVIPVIRTLEATEITGTSASSGAKVISNGGALFTVNGIVWSTVSGFRPDTATKQKTIQKSAGDFASELKELLPGTTYYVRAYAVNSVGLIFGNEIVLRTPSVPTLMTLTPIPATITSTSATSGGSIITNGGNYITSNGICWSTSRNPTLADQNVIAGSGSGNFTTALKDLMGSTKYYVRAFATNFAGTGYGNLDSLTTRPPVPVTIITAKGTDITATTATSGGEITSNGGALVSTRGVVWSIHPDFKPDTVSKNKTADTGYEKGVFISYLKKLVPGTTYYVRAYAVSIAGTSYGEVISFTTPDFASLTTNSPSLVANTSATTGGTVTSSGGSPVTERGIVWSTTANFIPDMTSGNVTSNGAGTGSFDSKLKDLKPDTKYYVRAYAVTLAGVAYGQQVSFTTYPPGLSLLTTLNPSQITGTTASSGGSITDEGGVVADTRGVVWSTQSGFNPATVTVNKTAQSGAGNGQFITKITGLSPGVTYYIRAYASNRVGTAYGNEISFTTPNLATLTTIEASSVTGTSALSGGIITATNGTPVTAQGVCWSTSSGPTIGLATRTSDAGAGVFTSSLNALKPVTKYYVRAYATNQIGTAYGNEISFTTGPLLASITTSDPVITSENSISSGGTITKDGGNPVTARGLLWSRRANFKPDTVVNNKTVNGSGIGNFISDINQMERSATYYIRAYATNSAGTAYGNQLTVSIFPTSPVLNTKVVTAITGSSAASGGEIVKDGGALITRRGIVWSTAQNPTLSLTTKTSDVDYGDGNFTSYLTGLQQNTTYYVRAYAVNGIGVAYGLEKSFTTLTVPTLTATTPATNVLATTAVSGGKITDDGRTPITSRGIVWSTYDNPTVDLPTKTIDRVTEGIGSFTANLSGLKPKTTYYVRAYATNSVGITYGSPVMITTNSVALPTLTTAPVTAIEGFSAMGGGNVTDDGGMPVVTRGIVWSLTSSPTIALPTKIINGTAGTGTFNNVFAGLIPGTTYYIRAFATNSVGTAYGNELTFTTSAIVPALSTVVLSNTKVNSADGVANLVSDGGAAVTDLGLIWNTEDVIPADFTNSLSVGAMGTSISGTLTNLLPATKYFVWAYGKNSIGTGYSAKSAVFTTPALATLITTKPGTITQNSANSGGTISSDGGVPVTARGICWSTAENPTADGLLKTVNGQGSGAFTSSMTGLTKGTKYYVRAYATNSVGTSYGNQESFTTFDVPSLKTMAVTAILTTSAVSGGEVTADNGAPVTARGVIWDTQTDPVVSLTSKTANGTGTGVFASNLTPLTVATQYYVRAYATNSIGTGYGNLETFKTPQVLPVVSVVTLSEMTQTTTKGTAEITFDGGAEITARGLVWNTTGNPTLENGTVIPKGTGTGSFTDLLKNLIEGPTYYITAYATNSVGTAYSPKPTSFKICPAEFTVTHTAGLGGAPVTKTITYHSVSTDISGAARCWITQNLGADRQALSATDGTEPSAGWYWQFNRLQGYKSDAATGRTPAGSWPVATSETVDWSSDNDPCVQLLSTGWRLPTETEWNNTYKGWKSMADIYGSVLKLHAAGLLNLSTGALVNPGSQGNYYSSTSKDANYVNFTYFTGGAPVTTIIQKTYGFPLRCLRDEIIFSVPSVSKVVVPAATMTASSAVAQATITTDGGKEVTDRGFVWNTTGNPTFADQVIHTGAGIGAVTAQLTGLTETPSYYIRAFATNSVGTGYSKETLNFRICPPSFVVTHVAGINGAPETKTVTYHAVNSTLSGAARCWLTQDLGADNEAASAADASDGASGWYWQFNKTQGFKSVKGVRTPNTPWIGSITENSDWTPANDPCVLLLGGGWRIPTAAEYTNLVVPANGLASLNSGYATELKLHAGGYLIYYTAEKYAAGTQINYWSNAQDGANARYPYINGAAGMFSSLKAYAMPIRCIRDQIVISPPPVTNVTIPAATMTAETAVGSAQIIIDGGAPVTAKGLVWNTTGNPTINDHVIPDGAGIGAINGVLTDLEEGLTYYVRAFGTNSAGTNYSMTDASFTICKPVTIIHRAGFNGAPADKTITYGTVNSSVTGEPKCWITQNLGADKQAAAINDTNEAAAGWYWQFNRLQGYSFTGTVRTPNVEWNPWAASISDNSNWTAANDPCTRLLGNGWRLPTLAEWTKAVGPPQNWTTEAMAYASELKLHQAGYIAYNSPQTGVTYKGSAAFYWSSTQNVSTEYGQDLYKGAVNREYKASALPVRCLRDAVIKSVPSVSKVIVPVAAMTVNTADGLSTVVSDGGAPVTARGLVWNTTGTAPVLNDGVSSSGTGTGDFTAVLKNLAEGPTYYVRAFATNSEGTGYSPVISSFKICNPFTVIHKAGLNGAPVDKTVTYKTVSSNISGSAKCWITQNLGSDREAAAVNDVAEAASGWFWQFNRLQGYKFEGTVRTPNLEWKPWAASISENSNWLAANDPCIQLLGGGWRLPTPAEWAAAASPPQNWKTEADAFASELKLHAAGYVPYNGSASGVASRGALGLYWSNTQNTSSEFGQDLYRGSQVNREYKASGLTVRCLRDEVIKTIPSVSNVAVPVAGMTASTASGSATVTTDGIVPVTIRGLVWNTTGLAPTTADQVIAIGKGTGEITGTLNNLVEGPTYYVRAFATNSEGTAYSPEVTSFKICNPFTVIHKAGLNGAPVDKTVIYKTVNSNVSGSAKCWITQNLGADKEAAAVNDVTEAASGWFWQFNRLQGYKFEGTTRTPNLAWAPWAASISENSDWLAANDPCIQLLGGGWRLPTPAEWAAAASPPQNWKTEADIFASELKIHAAGYVPYNGAASGVSSRGSLGLYWSNTQNTSSEFGQDLYRGSQVNREYKASGLTVRCLRDAIVKTVPAVSNVVLPVSAMTLNSAEASATIAIDGSAPVISRGLVWNTTGLPTLADQVIKSGNGTGNITGTITDLVEGPTYYVRAFATNAIGTAYSPAVSSFKICNPFTVVHKAGVNGAPVDKTVNYGAITSTVTGTAKCWITQNLGADRQAVANNEIAEAASGWFWQFNRLQGYKVEGTTRTPNTVWVTSISENTSWAAANDPCIQLLGGGWRLPTPAEWATAVLPPQNWKTEADIFASELKIHAAGYVPYNGAASGVSSRGSLGLYWSNTQNTSSEFGQDLYRGSQVNREYKASGLTIRCLKD